MIAGALALRSSQAGVAEVHYAENQQPLTGSATSDTNR
jgi:hypothetical protein